MGGGGCIAVLSFVLALALSDGSHAVVSVKLIFAGVEEATEKIQCSNRPRLREGSIQEVLQ